MTNSCVLLAGCVAKEGEKAAGRVDTAGGVVKERVSAGGGVAVAGGIEAAAAVPMAVLLRPVVLRLERLNTVGRVVVPVVLVKSASKHRWPCWRGR